jgi:hydrogenase/urease accessory protein HupE
MRASGPNPVQARVVHVGLKDLAVAAVAGAQGVVQGYAKGQAPHEEASLHVADGGDPFSLSLGGLGLGFGLSEARLEGQGV